MAVATPTSGQRQRNTTTENDNDNDNERQRLFASGDSSKSGVWVDIDLARSSKTVRERDDDAHDCQHFAGEGPRTRSSVVFDADFVLEAMKQLAGVPITNGLLTAGLSPLLGTCTFHPRCLLLPQTIVLVFRHGLLLRSHMLS